MAKVKISADSTCDLTSEIKDRCGIPTYPLTVLLGENEYRDGENIDPQMIFDYVEKTNQLPKTAAINYNSYLEIFTELTKNGDSVVHFCISSELSASYQNASLASQEFDNVYVVDTRALSTGMGVLIMNACDLRGEGKSAKEIFELVSQNVNKVQTSFVVDTLDYLHKGGRCSSLALIAGKVLGIRPYIKMKGGKLGVYKKYRGNLKIALTKYVEQLSIEYPNPIDTRVFITHSNCTDDVVELVKTLINQYFAFKEIIVTVAGSTITSHCGKGTLGVLFLNSTTVE